ncbi:MAG: EamA family transporter [Sphaerochaetaceae bacterium]|jgi:drug/metabolite transporter (DMT)-like permease|nr:EamA family transporter [Sphaerochaetaceae bacterium]MDD3366185.1 EamA family transporter [Sphaerochaetaceae bacterium]MDD4219261.1 EamA family transporter [Sphaerochaetaceae bacterium]MDY0371633.1 EamA family transporter [Sphaerochaetaceae bacterium]
MGKKSMSGIWLHIMLFLITVSWAFNIIVLKIGFRYIPTAQFSGVRLLMAFPFMVYFAFWLPGHVRFTKQDFFGVVGIGCVGLGLFQVLFPLGIDQTSPAIGGLLMATMPIHAVILSLIFRLERPRWLAFLGVILTVGGIALITLASQQPGVASQTSLKGILLVVIAEIGYAVNTVFLRPYMKRYPPIQVTGLAMATSVCIYLVVFFRDILQLVPSEVDPRGWLCAAYSGLFAFLFTNILWNIAIKNIGSTKVAVYANLPPVLVLFLSALIFGETLNGMQMGGAVIILLGVITVQLRKPNFVKKLEEESTLQ